MYHALTMIYPMIPSIIRLLCCLWYHTLSKAEPHQNRTSCRHNLYTAQRKKKKEIWLISWRSHWLIFNIHEKGAHLRTWSAVAVDSNVCRIMARHSNFPARVFPGMSRSLFLLTKYYTWSIPDDYRSLHPSIYIESCSGHEPTLLNRNTRAWVSVCSEPPGHETLKTVHSEVLLHPNPDQKSACSQTYNRDEMLLMTWFTISSRNENISRLFVTVVNTSCNNQMKLWCVIFKIGNKLFGLLNTIYSFLSTFFAPHLPPPCI